jgi:glycosyltransferase involved in cell wall biosynthesis
MSNNLAEIKVAIILPNYNSEAYLDETINSIIDQTFKNWKLIIVDGNSNDETQRILQNYIQHPNINVIRLKKNKRAGFCRNLAMRNSNSDYVAFIDSDDIWDREKLSKQLDFMIKNDYHFTYTNYLPFKSEKKRQDLKEIKPANIFTYEKFVRNTSIATSTMIIKKSSIGNVKFSNTKICEDYFFKCKILKKVTYAHCLSKNLMRYRIRKDSLQSNKIRNLYWIWYINKNYNKMNFLNNLLSIFFISINSIKKYRFK